MENVLKGFFGHKTFLPHQKEIITKILNGTDCLVVMATGSGKSICYQVPPLITRKTAIVISPLISLMQDQVMGLKQRGIRAEYLGSAQSDSGVSARALRGDFDVLYMTPEKACNSSASFWSSLLEKGVCLLAVDEAHCVSEWGHDFRHEYQKLDSLRPHLPAVPFVALTATATHRIREDIAKALQLQNYFKVISTFDRPNIYYGVGTYNRTSAFREELGREVFENVAQGGSTLIYCTTVKDVEEVAGALAKSGVNARPYHAQMSPRLREETHRAFSTDELQVVVATVAFGMGIDKPDIRRVIHYGCPKSLEAYYQESGRCGRDGLPATSWLYFTRQDFTKGDFYASPSVSSSRRAAVMDAYSAAQKYCTSTDCRRKTLLQYFGEMTTFQNCGNCDNCKRPGGVERRDMAEAAHLLLSAVRLCGGRWGLNMPIDVLRGSKAKKILENGYEKWPIFGLGREKSPLWWKALADQLLGTGHLIETRKLTQTGSIRLVGVGSFGEAFLAKSSNVAGGSLMLPLTPEMVDEERKQNGSSPPLVLNDGGISMYDHLMSIGLSEVEIKLYNRLLEVRLQMARRNFTAPYAICNETTLQKIAKARPSTEARFRMIDGVNQWLATRHCGEILSVIQEFAEKHSLPPDNAESTTPQVRLPGGVRRTPSKDERITPAKEEAWRMWQEKKLSLSAIANLPDRPKPIKEDTVIAYIADCVTAGYEIDLERLCTDAKFTKEKAEQVRVAVEKAGTIELLRPIKELLPESVTYAHIKIYLMMESQGFSFPASPQKEQVQVESNDSCRALDPQAPDSQHDQSSVPDTQANGSRQSQKLATGDDDSSFSKPAWISSENEAVPTRVRRRIPAWPSEDLNKKSKVDDN